MQTVQDTYADKLAALHERLDKTLTALPPHDDTGAEVRVEGEKLRERCARLRDQLRNTDDRAHAGKNATSGLADEFHALTQTATNWIKSIDQGFHP